MIVTRDFNQKETVIDKTRTAEVSEGLFLNSELIIIFEFSLNFEDIKSV